MITPEEEAIGRLQGLRHVISSGNAKAVSSLCNELGSLATDRLENTEIRDRIAQVVSHIDTAISAGGGKGKKLDAVLSRIDQTLASIDALLSAEQPDAAEAPAVEATPVVAEVEAARSSNDDSALIDTSMLPVFISEAAEHLENAEQNLLELEQEPSNKSALDAVFRGFHSVKGNAGFLSLTQIGKLAHEAETLFELIRSGKAELTDTAAELALLSVDMLRQMIDALGAVDEPRDEMPAEAAALVAQLVALIHSIQAGEAPPVREPAQPNPAATEPAAPSNAAAAEPSAPAPAPNPQPTAAAPGGKKTSGGIVRVDQDRLDDLINLIGELVTAESIVSSTCDVSQHEEAEQSLIHLKKITDELQQLSLSLRMVPIHDLFQKQVRLVRDLGRKLNKPVELVIEGGATELDKNVIDQLADPLVHIVRNSIDHGIEPSTEERLTAGKAETATVTLSAGYVGGHIRVAIRDDGRGLNREKILAKAMARGVVPTDAELTGQQIDQLIFHAGLSTAEKITDVSGRGVGMDVVARNIESLRGVVQVNSEPGVGTEIEIILPMTLAIIDGLVVTTGDHRFVIPSHEIERLVECDPDQIANLVKRQPILTIRGKHLPVFPLDALAGFHRPAEAGPGKVIVVAKAGNHTFGLLVDQVVNRQQVVIKQLGDAIGGIEGVTGGAVMGDGQVALIVDLAGMHQRVLKRRSAG